MGNCLFLMHALNAHKPCPQVTIFVHGTHLTAHMLPKKISSFCKLIHDKEGLFKANDLPQPYFFRAVLEKMASYNPHFISYDHSYVFVWSGKLSHHERLHAAQELHKSLLALHDSYSAQYPSYTLTVITHSHGGNVVLNLAQIPAEKPYLIDRLILLAAPVQKVTADLICSSLFKTIYAPHSHWDMLQILDTQKKSKKEYLQKSPLFSQRHFKNSIVKHINITSSYFGIKRGIMHVEFLFSPFIKQMHTIITQADNHDFASGELEFDIHK